MAGNVRSGSERGWEASHSTASSCDLPEQCGTRTGNDVVGVARQICGSRPANLLVRRKLGRGTAFWQFPPIGRGQRDRYPLAFGHSTVQKSLDDGAIGPLA